MAATSSLAKFDRSQWSTFLNISDLDLQSTPGAENDLLVGRRQELTLTIKNGATLSFRDIVVLGNLTIETADPSNTAVKANLNYRDIVIVGRAHFDNLKASGRHHVVYQGNFREELTALLKSAAPDTSTPKQEKPDNKSQKTT